MTSRLLALLASGLVLISGCAQSTTKVESSAQVQDSQEIQAGVEAQANNEPDNSQISNDSGQTETSDSKSTNTNTADTETEVEPSAVSTPRTTTLLTSLIRGLRIVEEVTDGYDRDLFKHWTDADGDGCNTRYEVLIEESLTQVTVGSGCKLLGGTWVSAFDLAETTDPSTFDIDHVVPLKEAWDSGAWAWDAATREAFANDLGYKMSLIAVSASSNRSKSDRDPTSWLPTNSDYWCEYITAWVQVKTRWALSVDAAEKSNLESVAKDCAGEALDFAPKASTVAASPSPSSTSTPTKTSIPTPSPSPTATATSTPSPSPTPTQTASGGCTAGQVDINSASYEELKRIKYIDEVRAQYVIDLRPFKSVDGLINVKGIGPVYLQRMKDEGIACVN